MGTLFEEFLSKISYFECVAGLLALGVLREQELGEEFGVEEKLAQC
jgi:hypothetical protein